MAIIIQHSLYMETPSDKQPHYKMQYQAPD